MIFFGFKLILTVSVLGIWDMGRSICVFVNSLCLCLVCIWFYYSSERDIADGMLSFEVHHHG